MSRARRTGALAAALAVSLTATVPFAAGAAASGAPPVGPGLRPAILAGNNHEGTTDVVDPETFERLARINVVPDLAERMAEIQRDPVRLAFFLAIRQAIGDGNDQLNDDVFTSLDGRFLYVSRPSLADVVSIDMATGEIVWRLPMDGQRSDHMGLSPDGTRLLVSDSTERKVHVIDPVAGEFVGEFESGDTPHENNYSKDASKVFHASIGRVFTPLDQPAFDTTKGDRYFQIVDTETNQVTKRLVLGEVLEASGFGDRNLDSAVRPMAIAPDEKTVFLQLSFLHGFVELDLETDRVTRIADLPLSEEAKDLPREQYPLDSAHHGLAINAEGSKLCAAGTVSGYAAIVDRDTFEPTLIDVGSKPYWSTNSADGTQCYVSVSGEDRVVVIDYATEKEVARFDVGNHPQRVRNGVIRSDIVAAGSPGAGAPPAGGPAAAPPPDVVPAAVSSGRSGSRALAATGSDLALPAALALLAAGGAVAARRRGTARD